MEKNKAPAFQFYAQDFVYGTKHMTAEEVGGYIRLLCEQWDKGWLPDDDQKLIKVAGIKKRALSNIREKFVKGKDGKLFNKRLVRVRKCQLEFRKKRSEAGKKGAYIKWQKDGYAINLPMANRVAENDFSSSSSSITSPSSSSSYANKKEGETFFSPPTLEDLKLFFLEIGLSDKVPSEAERFFNHYTSNGWKVGQNKMQNWRASAINWKGKIKDFNKNENFSKEQIEQKIYRQSKKSDNSQPEKKINISELYNGLITHLKQHNKFPKTYAWGAVFLYMKEKGMIIEPPEWLNEFEEKIKCLCYAKAAKKKYLAKSVIERNKIDELLPNEISEIFQKEYIKLKLGALINEQ